MSKYVKIEDVMAFINTSNRGSADYFIVDQIENLCKEKAVDMPVKALCQSLSTDEKDSLANVVLSNLTPSEIYTKMNAADKDALYRMLWSDYVFKDVEAKCKEDGIFLNEAGIEEIVNRYVYNGDYDCNLSYWDNIDCLVRETAEYEEYVAQNGEERE